MSDPLDSDAVTAAFFGADNGFRWGGPDQERLKIWADDLRHPSRPIFLPRKLPDGRVRWYVLARTLRLARDLREQLCAFLGRGYTDFDGRPAELRSADPVEAVISGKFPAAFTLLVIRHEDVNAAETQFTRLRSLLLRRPARADGATPTLGRLVREFDLALRAEDRSVADRLLSDIRARGELGPHELGWLKVRLLAAGRQWRETLELPELADLIARPRPGAVTAALQEAVYHVHLARFGDENSAAAFFRQELATIFGPLFRTRPLDPASPGGKAATIAATAFAQIVAVPVAPEKPSEPTTEEKARRLMEVNDYEGAYRVMIAAPPTAAGFGLLLVCAADHPDSPTIAREVIAAFDAVPDEIRKAITSRKLNRTILDDLRGHLAPPPVAETPVSAPAVPTGWYDWLTRVNGAGPWPKAAEAARAGVREWTTDGIRDDPLEQERFVEALAATRIAPAAALLRNCLPQLLEAFLPNGSADPRLRRIYRQFLELIVLDEHLSAAFAGAILELASAVLACGLPEPGAKNEYVELVELLELGSAAFRTPTQFGRAVTLLDRLAENGVHLHADPVPLVQTIATSFGLAAGRVTDGQWAMLERACADFGQPDLCVAVRPKSVLAPDEEDEETRFRRDLDGKTVVLHTLQPQIAAAFLRAVEFKFHKTKFTILREMDESKRLKDVAQNADVYIVNTFDLPHAATGPVKKYRSEDNTLYPTGKNADQQVEALYRWLRTGATSPLVED